MLSPEVWNLKPTANNITFRSGIYDVKNRQYVENVVRNHHFNETVSLIIPNCDGPVPENIVSLFKESDYYRIDGFDLKILLNREFIEGFIKRGKFTALSWNPRNDIENCYAITPDGKLILSVDKELYQSLGLEAQKSKVDNFRNIVKIDLKHPNLHGNKAFFERVKRALDNEAFTNISLQFSWDPPNSSICPSSVAKYFNDQNYEINLCRTKIKVNTDNFIRCPNYIPGNQDDQDRPHELMEYLAMRMLSCDTDTNEALNSYREVAEIDEIRNIKVIHCKGFYSSSFISRLLSEARKITSSPWLTICINGFEYSPLTFFNHEHGITSNGDNNYAILFYPDNKFLFYQNSSSNKKQY